jgi:hypothetical protein
MLIHKYVHINRRYVYRYTYINAYINISNIHTRDDLIFSLPLEPLFSRDFRRLSLADPDSDARGTGSPAAPLTLVDPDSEAKVVGSPADPLTRVCLADPDSAEVAGSTVTPLTSALDPTLDSVPGTALRNDDGLLLSGSSFEPDMPSLGDLADSEGGFSRAGGTGKTGGGVTMISIEAS